MESKVKHQYDALLALQPVGSVAITSSADAAHDIGLDRLTGGRGDVANRYGEGSFDIVFLIEAVDATTGNETYSIAVKTVDANGANPVTQDTFTVTAAAIGQRIVKKYDTDTLAVADNDAAKVRVTATLGGATPSLKYVAFVAPNSCA